MKSFRRCVQQAVYEEGFQGDRYEVVQEVDHEECLIYRLRKKFGGDVLALKSVDQCDDLIRVIEAARQELS